MNRLVCLRWISKAQRKENFSREERTALAPTKKIRKMPPMHIYEVRPRKDKRGVDLISDVLPFGRLWYGGSIAVSNAIGYATILQPVTARGNSRLGFSGEGDRRALEQLRKMLRRVAMIADFAWLKSEHACCFGSS